jgi:hypothetical protein
MEGYDAVPPSTRAGPVQIGAQLYANARQMPRRQYWVCEDVSEKFGY